MSDQIASSLLTVVLLAGLFLWAMIVDFCIHLRKKVSAKQIPRGIDRRKPSSGAFN